MDWFCSEGLQTYRPLPIGQDISGPTFFLAVLQYHAQRDGVAFCDQPVNLCFYINLFSTFF